MKKFKLFLWSFINTGGAQIIAFVATTFIARIATPKDFGVFAIAAAIVLVGNIFAEAGFSSTIIYDDEFCEEKASTILWLSVFASAIISLFLVLSSGTLASYFEAPNLHQIMPYMAMTCIATSFGNIHAALIARNLQFKKKAVLALGSNAISVIIGLSVAFSGRPLAGLVVNFLLTPTLLTILMWFLAPWRVRLLCKPRLIYGDIAFAGNIAFSSFLEQVFKSIIVFFLGQRFDVVTVGYFNRADAVKNFASKIIDKVVQRVAFPLLSKARSNQIGEMLSNHLVISQALIFILLPLVWYIYKFADDIILLLFGPSWSESTSLLKVIILGGFFIPLTSLNLTLLKSNGRTFFILLNKGLAVLLISTIVVFGNILNITTILSLLITIYFVQLVCSVICLACLPNFHFSNYFISTLWMVSALFLGIAFYEVWAIFHFDFMILNLVFHGVAIIISTLCICFIFRRKLYNY